MILEITGDSILAIISIIVSMIVAVYAGLVEKRLQKSELKYNRRLDKLQNADKEIRETLSILINQIEEKKIDYTIAYNKWKKLLKKFENSISFLTVENDTLYNNIRNAIINIDDLIVRLINNKDVEKILQDLKSIYKKLYKTIDLYITKGKIKIIKNENAK